MHNPVPIIRLQASFAVFAALSFPARRDPFACRRPRVRLLARSAPSPIGALGAFARLGSRSWYAP